MHNRAIGIDGYNQSITGDVAMTVTCAASDCHHVPLVIQKVKRWKNDSHKRRALMGIQEDNKKFWEYSQKVDKEKLSNSKTA